MADRVVVNINSSSDSEILEKIFRSNYREIYSYALYLVNDPDISKDLVQESFLYTYENISKIHNKESLLFYIKKTIHSKAMNLVTRNKNIEKHHRIINGRADSIESFNSIYSYLTVKEIESIIQVVIEDLPDKSRKVFELSRMSGLKHEEIAEQLSISYKTVEVHIYRVLKILKVKLSEFRTRD